MATLRFPRELACCAIACATLAVAGSPAAEASSDGVTPYARQVPERGHGFFAGRAIDFHVVGGYAVVEGDIIIGDAQALQRALADRDAGKAFTIGDRTLLWPRGASGAIEVPFTVEADAGARVPAVVAAFNATFDGFIVLVPRTSQQDYVAFALNLPASAAACSSNLGRIGGRQTITGPPDCPLGALLHEVGHAIGLLHEQQRPDRDQYLTPALENLTKIDRTQVAFKAFNREVASPYDYGSIMHYGAFAFSANGRPTFATLPPGIGIGQRGSYSAADIDAVHRLYGDAPSAIVVTSLPEGLSVTVDGQATTTPATFNWPIGSVHTLDVPQVTQVAGTLPHVFARWNVDVAFDGSAARTINVAPGQGGATTPTQSPAVTVYTANFARLHSFNESVNGDTAAAKAATTATVVPAPEAYPGLAGLYFREHQPITLVAQVNPGFAFGGWSFNSILFEGPGPALSPWTIYASAGSTSPDITVQAYAKAGPLVRIRGRGSNGTVDGFTITVDGVEKSTPYSTFYPSFAGPGAHQVLATPTQFDGAATTRYRFTDWDGSAANPVPVSIPAAGTPSSEITAHFDAAHLVTASPRFSCAGTVAASPASVDGFHPSGEQLTLTATPAPGFVFAGWKDDLTGTAMRQTLGVAGEVLATPQFNVVAAPLAVTGSSRRFIVAGEPSFKVTLFGTGFTAATIVFVNGVPRPATLVDANRVQVSLVQGDYAAPGEVRLTAQNVAGFCAVADTTSLPVRAAGATWPATIDVVEFYHAGLDHYFISANPDEIAKLDNGTFKGWSRTGRTFKVFPSDSTALASGVAHAVCRYYGNPSAGLDSHFYTGARDECDDVRRKFPDAWVFESSDVFQAVFPDRVTGECPDQTVPVYRLFNQRSDVNHRYTTDTVVRTQMIAKGYVPEGYGSHGVALCTLP